ITDPGSPYNRRPVSHIDYAPFVVAILAHLYLLVAGLKLMINLKPSFLRGFFVAEAAYALLLLLLAMPLDPIRILSPPPARCFGDVSIGFLLQLVTGFPLWGWLLTRK